MREIKHYPIYNKLFKKVKDDESNITQMLEELDNSYFMSTAVDIRTKRLYIVLGVHYNDWAKYFSFIVTPIMPGRGTCKYHFYLPIEYAGITKFATINKGE